MLNDLAVQGVRLPPGDEQQQLPMSAQDQRRRELLAELERSWREGRAAQAESRRAERALERAEQNLRETEARLEVKEEELEAEEEQAEEPQLFPRFSNF
ncbi:hypothetical protein ASPWEDRAFT_35464 [Aspergillus wentii DTO 134E9]|uniref:Uncharacterized protein n=1 Tax=Aspergillus wentii DTO 134E9 TaxID=1073089 RepID=A0A1L9S3Y8_ASPWE|nr:uncharacterized protein ASPWEDRAFT_35464 [Aspergillus wentii DTO 134E9]OJJ41853.1 hypothetical protein ASPWEDRAFT_35464 [Aspergillus wentii DTO 134E9]